MIKYALILSAAAMLAMAPSEANEDPTGARAALKKCVSSHLATQANEKSEATIETVLEACSSEYSALVSTVAPRLRHDISHEVKKQIRAQLRRHNSET